jgi:hypothetical protein
MDNYVLDLDIDPVPNLVYLYKNILRWNYFIVPRVKKKKIENRHVHVYSHYIHIIRYKKLRIIGNYEVSVFWRYFLLPGYLSAICSYFFYKERFIT